MLVKGAPGAQQYEDKVMENMLFKYDKRYVKKNLIHWL